jgi:hypothetical protein
MTEHDSLRGSMLGRLTSAKRRTPNEDPRHRRETSSTPDDTLGKGPTGSDHRL